MASHQLTGLFADRYQIERELGHGATAVVYLAHDNKHNREIALKVLSKDLAHALGPERFLREIQVTSRLSHPHILPIFDSGEWNGMLYYVLPYVRGESLRQKIDRENQLPIEECVRITCEVADALAHAHARGIVHRDVKPENIMLSDGHALLADFGIARTLDVHTGERLTSSGLIVGTSAYMSPEQAAGEENIDARSDIYSLACVLYEMIAGVQAFTGPTTQSVIAQRFKHTPRPVSTFRPQVPEYLEKALEKALTIAPADRYQSVKKFAADLPEVSTASQDRRQSPIRRIIYGREKAFGFGAAALAVISAAFVIANPGGDWRSLFFSTHVKLDSTKFAVVPSPSQASVASRIDRELEKWSGVKIVDPEVIKDALDGKKQVPSGEAFDLAKKYGAGRLIRVNSEGNVSSYNVATGDMLNEVSADEINGSGDTLSAAVLKLLRDKDRPRSADGGDGRTTSYIAWSAYGRAHKAMAEHDYQKAHVQLLLAVAADDKFSPARVWLAQLAAWIQPGARDDWKADGLRVAASANSLAPRERAIAVGLGELARERYPEACAAYRRWIERDSTDFIGWMGLGECQRLNNMVVPSGTSPSGYAFRSSLNAAYAAFVRATESDPGAFDLIGFDRLRRLKTIEANTGRAGEDVLKHQYGSYPTLDHDTVATVPYPMSAFAALPIDAFATRRAALDRNLSDLLVFTRAWVAALPKSAQAYEALATVLEGRGEIEESNGRGLSASAALSRAIELSPSPAKRIRMRASEMRLRLKRGEFAAARSLADSLLTFTSETNRSILDDLIGVAASTGRIALAAKLILGSAYIPSEANGIRVQPQVAAATAQLLMHAALGDCGPSTERERTELDRMLSHYYSEKEAATLRSVLEARAMSLMSPCTRAQSSLSITGSRDRLAMVQQAFARGDLARMRSLLDSIDAKARILRPGDMALEYSYQLAWLRSAAGDTAGAIRQLDATLGALPSVGGGTLREPAGAAALGRAMILRADLAAASRDGPTARGYAKAVAELWAGADPELQPVVARMRGLAGSPR